MKGTRLFPVLALVTTCIVWAWIHLPERPPKTFEEFLDKEGLAGVVVAVQANGRATNIQTHFPTNPKTGGQLTTDTRLPIASLSKPLTAATIRALIREGNLRLEDHLFDLLPSLPYADDSGYRKITVQQLLQHTAGFDRTHIDDPLFSDGKLAGCDAAIERAVSRPLDNLPGTHMSYSNAGYCLLGRIIERTSGQTYEQAVLYRFPRLVTHATLGPSFPGIEQPSDPAFANWRDAGPAGGWYVDAAALSEQFARDARDPSIFATTAIPYDDYYYGLGWRVWPCSSGYRLTHFGGLPGTFAVALAYPDGRAVVALFRGRPREDEMAFRSLLPLLDATLSGSAQ